MSQTATKAGFTAYCKSKYGEISKAIPDSRVIAEFWPFEKRDRIGDYFKFPVMLTRPAGWTRTAANATTATTLNTAIAGGIGQAQLSGVELIGRQEITYKLMSSAISNDAAYGSSVDLIMTMLKDGMECVRALGLIDGTKGIGVTESGASVDATTATVVLTAQSWSSARWVGSENSLFNFYNSTTIVGTAAADRKYTLTEVDPDTRTLTVTATAQGITDLLAVVNSVALDLYIESMYGKEAEGLQDIVRATGTLWNLDAGAYSAWKGQVHTISGSKLTIGDVFQAAAKASNKMAKGELVLATPASGFSSLLTDLTGQQRYPDPTSNAKFRSGGKYIEIWAGTTWCTVVPDNLMRDGKAYLFPKKGAKRVGSTEFEFGAPGMGDDELVFPIADKDACEIRSYADEAPVHQTPGAIIEIASKDGGSTL